MDAIKLWALLLANFLIVSVNYLDPALLAFVSTAIVGLANGMGYWESFKERRHD